MNIPSFLIELVQRLGAKTPKFFKTLQLISSVAATVIGLPELLAQFHVQVPKLLNPDTSVLLAVCGYVVAIVSQLPVETPAAPVNDAK